MTAQVQPRLTIIPCDLADANAFVRRFHRHHLPVVFHKFSLGVVDDTWRVRGACIVARPVARMVSDGWTAEVTRLVTDGCPNACSALYGAAWRTARAMGYLRLGTYLLESEPGTSVRAAGWRWIGVAGGGSWDVPSRPRTDKHPTEPKQRWEIGATPPFPPSPIWPTADEHRPQLSLFEELSA